MIVCKISVSHVSVTTANICKVIIYIMTVNREIIVTIVNLTTVDREITGLPTVDHEIIVLRTVDHEIIVLMTVDREITVLVTVDREIIVLTIVDREIIVVTTVDLQIIVIHEDICLEIREIAYLAIDGMIMMIIVWLLKIIMLVVHVPISGCNSAEKGC
ncbi:uncharacterized protein [Temnothorax nylanderi]|uniref:uncharacterized protein isoform X2 n=1 Tax=Temnothorax nylanderi TaxID=102681 RepID=UPI003A8C0A8E